MSTPYETTSVAVSRPVAVMVIAPLKVSTSVSVSVPVSSISNEPAPETDERLWLSLGFAYMVVITALAWIASTDPVRHRPMLLALAAGKAASSATSLIFFIEDDVFVYLLNGIVDGFLVGASLLLYALAGRIGAPAAPG